MPADAAETILCADEPRRGKEQQECSEQQDASAQKASSQRPAQVSGRFFAGREQVVQQSENLVMAHGVEVILSEYTPPSISRTPKHEGRVAEWRCAY